LAGIPRYLSLALDRYATISQWCTHATIIPRLIRDINTAVFLFPHTIIPRDSFNFSNFSNFIDEKPLPIMVRTPLIAASILASSNGALAALQTCGQAQYDPAQVCPPPTSNLNTAH